MKTSVFAGLLLSAIAGSAMAADLPRRGGVASEPYFASAPFNWTGIYAGLNAGYGFGHLTRTGGQVGHVSGGLVGGTLGYNYQYQQVVLGVEGDLDWARINGGRVWDAGGQAVTGSARVSSLASVRGRIGFAADRALVYVTGGYAGGNLKVTVDHPATPFFGSASKWQNGYALGAGIEYAFTNNVSVKAEYLYTALNSKSYFPQDVLSAGTRVNQIRTGVNYRF